jgi:hypothetical protein
MLLKVRSTFYAYCYAEEWTGVVEEDKKELSSQCNLTIRMCLNCLCYMQLQRNVPSLALSTRTTAPIDANGITACRLSLSHFQFGSIE